MAAIRSPFSRIWKSNAWKCLSNACLNNGSRGPQSRCCRGWGIKYHGCWCYCDEPQDLNSPCFPANLRHLGEVQFCSDFLKHSTSPWGYQTCQGCFFQMTPASPAVPKLPLECQKEEVFPHPSPLPPTQTKPALSCGEGYSQLCANFSGPDAVEGVLQLHSPAKRREIIELSQKPISLTCWSLLQEVARSLSSQWAPTSHTCQR